MRIYRITPEPYLENYYGPGASHKDGARWNRAGQPVLYFAQSPATALLEMANYLPSPRLVPDNYRLGIYGLPDSLPTHIFPESLLPDDWAEFPYSPSTQAIGGDWLDNGKEVAFIVPSAAVPQGLEKIVVVNPNHEDCSQIQLIDSTSELYNKRTFSGV